MSFPPFFPSSKAYTRELMIIFKLILSFIFFSTCVILQMHKQRLDCPPPTQLPKDRRINIDDFLSSAEVKNKTRESMPPRSKLIRRQKILTCNTVEDQQRQKLDDLNIYVTHTPKYPKTQKQGLQGKKYINEVPSFNIDDSFSNKNNTIKKEYELQGGTTHKDGIALDRHQITLKNGQKQQKERKLAGKEEKASGNGLLILKDGWSYKGQYAAGLFHGFGQLYQNDSLFYSGTFEFGYFQGYGKLKQHPSFDYLINLDNKKKGGFLDNDSSSQNQWTAYFGEFSKGNVTGYGELWLASGEKIASKWKKGMKVGKHWVNRTDETQFE